ncbi:hypothetical protein GWI33_003420 [Rhynchophorus ferrugineus]|uniref:protein-tyrosine-phosphatase n=1 Tax=Rhynchophorus ferrugineus TaxID=354439 RepID=A0A834MPP5_RHYFE|nr:hypothetical protein GWI33_003420 [Rhynchophorus ferrugineus]
MDLEDHLLPSEHLSRHNMEYVSLYDTSSRDSGFDDIASQETLNDDGFLEEFSEIHFPSVSQLPTSFCNLIEKPIVAATIPTRTMPDLSEEFTSPLKKKLCQRSENENKGFAIRRKKLLRKTRSEEPEKSTTVQQKSFKLFSSEEIIKTGIQKSCESDLVGDFTREFSLPLTESKHNDLKAINGSTLRKLMRGEYSDKVTTFKIVDCRYPYEYEGGHITGAMNVYTHNQCEQLLEDCIGVDILIFHCEFSAERGPNLSRHLRKEDRRRNAESYPFLCFPEVYILEGGYNKFYSEDSSYCSPNKYVQMIHPEYTNELRFFRQKCKTLDSDTHIVRKKSQRSMNVKKLTF